MSSTERPKKPKKKPRWVAAHGSLAPDPRQSDRSKDPQRFIHALVLRDSRRRVFVKLGKQDLEPIEDPPEIK